MCQSSAQSASCANKGKIKNRVQIKNRSLLKIFFKILLSVMRRFLFWLVTLRLNTTLKICSSISSLLYMGVWRPWAEFPAGVNSTAGFFFSSICLHILFWDILQKISKKSWQRTGIFITQEIPLLKHFVLITNKDKTLKVSFCFFHPGKHAQLLFLKMSTV